jgi:hypothetical protein
MTVFQAVNCYRVFILTFMFFKGIAKRLKGCPCFALLMKQPSFMSQEVIYVIPSANCSSW